MIFRFLTIVMILLVSGCFMTEQQPGLPWGASPLTTYMGAEALTVMGTSKTIGDHITSHVTGLDCSTPRAQIHNRAVCREKAKPTPPRPTVYCYRTLATPDCFLEPSQNVSDFRIGYPY